MTKLNIENIPFRYTQECLLTLDEQLDQMYENYHSRILEDANNSRRIIIPKFHTSGGVSYDSNYEHIGTIENIAKEKDISIERAYKKYAPVLMKHRICGLRPCEFSCNKWGDIKIIIKSNLRGGINRFMNMYNYKLFYEEMIGEKLLILKYKLD